MPTQSRGFFACDYCGLQHDTLEEATDHELSQCPRVLSRRQIPVSYLSLQQQQQQHQHQQILPQRHQSYFLQQQQEVPTQQHQRYATMRPLVATATEGTEAYPQYAQVANYPGYRGISPLGGIDSYQKSATLGASVSTTPTRCFRIVDFPPDQSSNDLTVTDRLACQNIEIFEATRESISEYERTDGTRDESKIVPKQIGLRCRNCGYGSNNTNKNIRTTEQFSYDFSVDLASVGDSVRKITDRHIISCRMTDSEVREACQRAASKRQQRKRGLGVTFDDRNFKDDDDDDNDERTRSALVDYCIDFCQQKGIVNKASQQGNKTGIEFITTGDSSQAVGTRDFGTTIGGDPGGGSGSSYPSSYSGQQQPYDSSNLPFYQESDKTWHCKFCSYMPHQFRDSQSIWSSPGGSAPPNSFIEQHLSVCRVYQQQQQQQQQQQKFSLHPASIFPPASATAPTSYNILPYSNHPPSYGIQPHGPPPTSSWETTASIGGPVQQQHPHNLQYLPPHQESNYPYRYSQHLPPGITQSHAMESSSVGGRFLEQRDLSSAYSDGRSQGIRRGKRIVSERDSSALGSERGSHTGFGRENSTDAMNNAMDFLAQYDREYYERDPTNAAIPKLVLDEDHLLLTDYFFYLMKQLRVCRFTENDRKTRGGKREKIKIGYGGLQCIHCADLPMSRKFFWSNVDRLANSFAEIPGHVLKCRRCPQQNKDALMRLKQGHADQMSKLPRGSQKIFFRRMWRRLHDGDPQDEEGAPAVQVQVAPPEADIALESRRPPVAAIATSPEKGLDDLSQSGSHSGSITVLSDETILVMQRSAKEAAKALVLSSTSKSGPSSPSSRILVAIPEDKEWLSDIDAYVRKQLEVFCATEDDVAVAQADRKYLITLGQVGIRCIHCSIAQGHDAIGHAIAYPFSINAIYESVKEFHRLHLDSCPNLPATTKSKLNSMKGASSLSSVLRKYYTLAAKALGLRDTKNGIRTGGESNPIGSLAAFTFAEAEESSPTNNDEENIEDRKSSADERSEIGFAPSDASSRGIKRSGSPSVTLKSESKPKSAKRGI